MAEGAVLWFKRNSSERPSCVYIPVPVQPHPYRTTKLLNKVTNVKKKHTQLYDYMIMTLFSEPKIGVTCLTYDLNQDGV